MNRTSQPTRSGPWLYTIIFLLLISGFIVALPWLPALASQSAFYGIRANSPAAPLQDVDQNRVVPPPTGLAVVFFGYLQCGTVCPSQLMNLAALQERMAGNAVQFVFVSIDPERDSAQHLGSALRRFGPAFAAVRPESAAAARALARQYHDFATPAPGDRSSDINHAGHLHVVTASGRRELVYTSPNLDLDRVAQDLYRLLAQQALPSEAAH